MMKYGINNQEFDDKQPNETPPSTVDTSLNTNKVSSFFHASGLSKGAKKVPGPPLTMGGVVLHTIESEEVVPTEGDALSQLAALGVSSSLIT